MARYVQWITHKGVKILFLNGKGLPEAEYLTALEELKQEIVQGRSYPPTLIDQTNFAPTQKTTDKAREITAAVNAAGIPDGPSAVVGLTPTAKKVAEILERGMIHYFDTVDEAKEWLAQEAGKPR
jgi:hypothetical protein